jgi:methylmalonyl-CoA/ethylmalonyl-CoA epimerase
LLLETGAPSAVLYLRVESVRATAAALRTKGLAIETEPHVIFTHDDDTLGPAGTDEWMTFIRDSEGNLLGLVSQEERG